MSKEEVDQVTGAFFTREHLSRLIKQVQAFIYVELRAYQLFRAFQRSTSNYLSSKWDRKSESEDACDQIREDRSGQEKEVGASERSG